jgi:FixJ family two-component response regulator
VMGLVVAGMSNRQIASKIGIRQATVKFHRGRVMAKMRADSVPDLVRMAERLDLTGSESRSYATNG